MKKTIMIPLALLACTSLLIGCGGKKEGKPSNSESGQSSEPGPGPEPGPEETIVFPKTFDEAGFIDMGELTLETPEELRLENSKPISFEEMEFRSTDLVSLSSEQNPYYPGYESIAEVNIGFEVFDNDVCAYFDNETYYYNVEGFGRMEEYSSQESTIYFEADNVVYVKEEERGSGDYLWHSWHIADIDLDYLIEGFFEDISSFGAIYGQPAFTRIGDYIYIVGFTLNKDFGETDTAYGDYITYCRSDKTETIIKLNSDLLLEEVYIYEEITLDRSFVSGEFLDEPLITNRRLVYLENSYGSYRTYQNVPYVPDQYFYSASLSYKIAPVNFDTTNGVLLSAPEFPTDYSTAVDEFFLDYENAGLMFTPYLSNNQLFALQLGDLTITYYVLYGDYADEYNPVSLSFGEEELEEIAEIMGGQFYEYNEEKYLIIDQTAMKYLEFDFSTFGVQTMEDITIRELTTDFYLR